MNKLFILFIISFLVLQTVCFATEKGTREAFTMGKEIIILKKKIIELKGLIRAELQKDAPDQNLLHGYINDMNNAQAQIQIKRVDFLLKKRALQTEEQKKELFFSPAEE